MRELAVGGAVFIAVAGLGAYGLARAALSPVERLRRQVAALSERGAAPGAGVAAVEVPPTQDEVAALAGTMNDLLGRLQRALARQRAFVADASHELRNPLAVLRGELELAARPGRGLAELTAAVRGAGAEAERLARLTEDLLLLARSDEGRFGLRLERTDIGILLRRGAKLAGSRLAAAGVTGRVDVPPGTYADVDPDRILQAVDNLVGNALRFAPRGSVIVLAARAGGRDLEIDVSDDGPGFPVGFLPHAFERFTRPDSGRSRGDGGAGLGLAIVRAIAVAHGGTATAANKPGGGAVVRLRLPGCEQARPDRLASERCEASHRSLTVSSSPVTHPVDHRHCTKGHEHGPIERGYGPAGQPPARPADVQLDGRGPDRRHRDGRGGPGPPGIADDDSVPGNGGGVTGRGDRGGHDGDPGGRRPAGHPLDRHHHRLRRDRDHHDPDGQRQNRCHPGQARPGGRGQLMAAGAAGTTRAAAWLRLPAGDDAVAVAERAALGTSTRVVVWPPGNLDPACAAVDDVLAALDLQASRFRPDSELSWLNAARGGLFLLGDGLAEAVGVALAAARWTGGLTDPTVGDALVSLGYDRDFAAIAEKGEPPRAAVPAPGWHLVRLDGPLLRLPPGIRLDLGATAKGVGADRAVRAVMSATGRHGGVLVSLGGDIAVAGHVAA